MLPSKKGGMTYRAEADALTKVALERPRSRAATDQKTGGQIAPRRGLFQQNKFMKGD